MIKKDNKFILIENTKELIQYIDRQVVNFPNKEKELKQNLRNSSYELLLYAYEANLTESIDKKIDLQEKAISKIKMIDFLASECYDKQIINGKKYLRFGERLNNLIKFYVGWLNKARQEKNDKRK